jgi:hypothetical protein
MARPEGLEPPTNWFEASYSIQLSYERRNGDYHRVFRRFPAYFFQHQRVAISAPCASALSFIHTTPGSMAA